MTYKMEVVKHHKNSETSHTYDLLLITDEELGLSQFFKITSSKLFLVGDSVNVNSENVVIQTREHTTKQGEVFTKQWIVGKNSL